MSEQIGLNHIFNFNFRSCTQHGVDDKKKSIFAHYDAGWNVSAIYQHLFPANNRTLINQYLQMSTEITKSQQWSLAAKDGAILASISIGANIITLLSGKIAEPSVMLSLAMTILTFAVLVAKIAGSYLLLKKQLTAFGSQTGLGMFGYGLKVTLFSSILCAAFTAINLLYLSADSISQAMDSVMQMYSNMLDSNSLEMLDRLEEYMPLYSTISQFIWCYLLGIVFSRIIDGSRKDRSNPFGNSINNQETL